MHSRRSEIKRREKHRLHKNQKKDIGYDLSGHFIPLELDRPLRKPLETAPVYCESAALRAHQLAQKRQGVTGTGPMNMTPPSVRALLSHSPVRGISSKSSPASTPPLLVSMRTHTPVLLTPEKRYSDTFETQHELINAALESGHKHEIDHEGEVVVHI